MKRYIYIYIVLINSIIAQSANNIYQNNSPATVQIYTLVGNDVIGCGSGFIVDHKGTIVTNHHVIEGAESIEVELMNGEKYNVRGFYIINEEKDIAIMDIAGFDLPYTELGNSNTIQVGDEVSTIGNPLCIEDPYSKNTFTKGNVSQIFNDNAGIKWIKFTAPISSGNSGGPLLNAYGEVIGIVTASIGDSDTDISQNLNFAVPINYVRGYLKDEFTDDDIKYQVDYDHYSLGTNQHHSNSQEWNYDTRDLMITNCLNMDGYDTNIEQCKCIYETLSDYFNSPDEIDFNDEGLTNALDQNGCEIPQKETKNYSEYGWSEIKEYYFEDCIDSGYSKSQCTDGWFCALNMFISKYGGYYNVDWNNDSFIDQIDEECDYNKSVSKDYISMIEYSYMTYYNVNSNKLSAIEGIWEVLSKVYDSSGRVLSSEVISKCAIIRSENEEFDFIEYNISDEGDWIPANVSAFFESNGNNTYYSWQLNHNSDLVSEGEYILNISFGDEEIYNKETYKDKTYIHIYKKLYP